MTPRLVLFRGCKKCGRGPFRTEVMGDGMNYETPTALQEKNRTWKIDARPMAPCPDCGAIRVGREIQGRHVEHIKCGARCQSATGPACDCSCAGQNHGGQYAA